MGGVLSPEDQVAYAPAIELLTGANLMKMFPAPRTPTEKIPECKPHIKRGEHLKLYRFSPDDYLELAAVFKGPHHDQRPRQEGHVRDGVHRRRAALADHRARPLRLASGVELETWGYVSSNRLQVRALLHNTP